jgi:predicted enzyme related to lactoylglutathione lyase
MHGDFFWYDLMTTDAQSAQDFYRHVVGWDTQDAGVPGTDYTVLAVNGRGVAGLMAIPDHELKARMPPCWMGYVEVDDVDECLAAIGRAGGRTLRATVEIPGVIRFAVVADPQGAAFLVAKGLDPSEPPPLAAGTPGTVGWHELYAADWKLAFDFYESVFGWKKNEAIDMGPMGTYQLFATGAGVTGGMMDKPAEIPVAHWGYYFNVAALDAAVERVTGKGGRVLNGPMEVPGGSWIVNAMDPQNAPFSLVAPKR